MKSGFVYIVGNQSKSTLYTGVTSDLIKRVWEHKNKVNPDSFTSKYNLSYLYYYKHFEIIQHAILEEKRIKGGSRDDKELLVISINPEWNDLYLEIASSAPKSEHPRNDR